MKNIKPIYIYGAGIIIAALVFIFLSQKDSSDNTKGQANAANGQMPNDAIHKGMGGSNGMAPGKDNVMEEVKKHLSMLKKAVDENPNDTMKIKQYADFLAAAHQQDEAIVYYNKILNIDSKRTDVLLSVAYIHYTKQEFPEAEKYLNKILSYDKNNVQAYYNLGAVAASSGDKAKAKEIWSKMIKQFPKAELSDLARKSINEI